MISILPILGGLLSAWHGGQIVGGTPKAIKNIAWTVPFFVCTFSFLPFSFLIAFTGLNYLKTLGHGRGFRLKEPMEDGSERETVEYLILWLEGKIPLYWYKVLIMALSGLAAVIGSVIVFGYYNPLAGLVIALGGLSKGVNAMLFDKDTQVREYADGVCAYSGLLGAVIIMV